MSETKKTTSEDETRDNAPASEQAASEQAASDAARAPRERTSLDALMRGSVLILLGAVVTTPLWCQDEMTENFRPATFAADRSRGGEDDATGGLEGALTREITAIIRTASSDQIVDEALVQRQIGGLLEEHNIGDDESRQDRIGQMVADIVAQAAEMDGARGFSDLQAQAVQGTARMTARTLITNLGGTLEDAGGEEVEGDWTPAAWPIISGFEYEEGMELPEAISALDGQQVMAWGYLINLDEDQYLLVQSLWSCCFGTPPDIHEAIVVRAGPEAAEFEGRGVRVYGRFEASELEEDGYVTSLYRLDAEHVRGM